MLADPIGRPTPCVEGALRYAERMQKPRAVVVRRGHPLTSPTSKGSRVRRARLNLYETIGPGSHPCHWCGAPLRWQVTQRGADVLCADHLDDDTLNDDPANLVPSCRGCNGNRAQGIDRRKRRPCERCGAMFLPRRRTSQFCGLSCSSRSHMTKGEWVDHGKRSSYTRGCRCGPCRAAHSEYMAAYYQRRKSA